MIIIGTIFHIIIGALIAIGLLKSGLPIKVVISICIALMYWFKEMGEAKSKVPGSIKTLKKNLAMIAFTFKPKILVQWVLPGIGAYLLLLVV